MSSFVSEARADEGVKCPSLMFDPSVWMLGARPKANGAPAPQREDVTAPVPLFSPAHFDTLYVAISFERLIFASAPQHVLVFVPLPHR
jgi:hypothetical protein